VPKKHLETVVFWHFSDQMGQNLNFFWSGVECRASAGKVCALGEAQVTLA